MKFSAMCSSLLDRVLGRSYQSPSSAQVWRAVYAVCSNDNRNTRVNLYRVLLDGIFIVPKADHPRFEQIDPRPGKEPDFPLVEIRPGVRGLAIFTSTTALRAWVPAGCGYVLMQGQNMFLMAAHLNAKAVAINPGSSPSGVLVEWEIRRLAEGAMPVPQKDGTMESGITGKVAWGALDQPLPASFLEEAKTLLANQPEVDSAYALWASFNLAPKRSVLAVSCPVAPAEDRLSEFMPALVKLAESHQLDLYCFILEQHSWLADVRQKITPFFKRNA